MSDRFQSRAGQFAFERDLRRYRVCAFLTRRQYGKTTIAAHIALKKMIARPNHTIIFGSVKLDLGREIIRKESEVIGRIHHQLVTLARRHDRRLCLVDVQTGRALHPVTDSGGEYRVPGTELISTADLAELYEAQRLEFRLYFSRLHYSRTKVVALTPDTVGETGDLITDEVGRARRFRETCEAVKPIISSNPRYRWLITTTPPPDDTHYSFELLAPPMGWDPAPRPEGHLYRSEQGIHVRRITVWDAALDGVPLFDDRTGRIIDPFEARNLERDKDAWDRNYGVKFVLGGTGAVSLLVLENAQQRGRAGDNCQYFPVQNEADFVDVLAWLRTRLTHGPVGLGWDLATTERQTSNPSAFAVVEQCGADFFARAIATWKTADSALALQRVGRMLDAIKARRRGGGARRLCIDATNERYFSTEVRRKLSGLLPVEQVIASVTVDRPGQPPITLKQQLGERLVAALDDNRLALPGDRYIHEDFRLVRKERGQFVCEPDAQGRHGDTFDATKLALHALGPAKHTDVTPMTVLHPGNF